MRRLLLLFLVLNHLASGARAEFLPALRVEPLTIAAEAEVESELQALISTLNATLRAEAEIPLFVRVYVSRTLDGRITRAFALYPSASFEGLENNRQRYLASTALAPTRARWSALTTAESPVFFKARRFDGTHSPGALLNLWVATEDEAGLLAAATRLHGTLASDETAPPFINVFAVVAGESEATHLVSFNCATPAARATLLDWLATPGATPRWPQTRVLATLLYDEL